MKKLVFILSFVWLVTGCCLSQLPTQYVYADENCQAVLDDYLPMVVVSDNCSVVDLRQEPAQGVQINGTTDVFIRAIDEAGNETVMSFDVIVLDTISPVMELNPAWTGYTNQEIATMYKNFYAWIQEKGDEYNEVYAGTDQVAEFPDTTIYYKADTMKYFFNTIPIMDYRIDEGYWAKENPNIAAMFAFKPSL